MRLPRRTALAVSATVALAATGAAVYAAAPSVLPGWPYATAGSQPNAAANAAAAPPVTLAVVGDTACEPDDDENAATPASLKCGSPSLGGMSAAYDTVDEIEAMKPQALALLGDEQYQVGKLSDFEKSFDKTYGALKWIIKPAPGNHEYYSYAKKGDNEAAQDGTGYFSYFNGTDQSGKPRQAGQAGDDTDATQGWYSYNLGDWHVISLNAECGSTVFGGDGVGGTAASCDPTQGLAKAETDWLSYDLSKDKSRCTIAYWHQPTFSASSSPSPEGGLGDAWWKLLYAHGHAIVLNGHEHYYARFSPMDPAGNVDNKFGIPEFIVGSGGEALDTLDPASTLAAEHVVTGEDTAYGAMKMTLGQNGTYSWDFEPSYAPAGAPADAMSYSDKGTATC